MNDISTTDFQKLADHCSTLPPGPVTNVAGLQGLLANVWDDICGGGMTGMKLFNRMEDVRWASPILSFVIERHGGFVMGSTRAELQYWQVDIEKRTAILARVGQRQVLERAKNFPFKAVVAEIIDAIQNGTDDERIQWDGPHSVKLLTCKVFPTRSAFKRTLEGRRKHFRTLMAEELSKVGWDKLKIDRFQRKG